MSRKIVHVIGTGTIGEPLIGILCDYKEDLGLDEITFHKNTPLTTDRSKVRSLINRGARLSTDRDKFDRFNALDLKPELETKAQGTYGKYAQQIADGGRVGYKPGGLVEPGVTHYGKKDT